MVLSESREPVAAVPAAMVTRRLVLRPPRDGDLDALVALYADPAVTRFCAAATPQGRDATRNQLQAWMDHWHAYEMISVNPAPSAMVRTLRRSACVSVNSPAVPAASGSVVGNFS